MTIKFSNNFAQNIPADHHRDAVLATIEALEQPKLLDLDLVNPAFSGLRLEGRFQTITNKCLWVLDVAHNPAAAVVFADRFRSIDCSGSVTAIVGMLRDKDMAGFLAPFSDIVDRWVAVTVEGPRAATAMEVGQQVSEHLRKPCQIIDDIGFALNAVYENVLDEDVVIITGSFHVVGPALEWLQQN